MMYNWNASGWAIASMIIMMTVFWGGVIGIGILVFRARARGDVSDRPPSATEVLSHRFANGELSTEEYESRLATLRQVKL